MVLLSPRQCPGIEGRVCGRFLSSKEHDPHRLCVSCRGKSCHQDDRCDECHEWPEEFCKSVVAEEFCKSVVAYEEKLLVQHEKKKERKAKSSSSFSGFSPSMSVPLRQLLFTLPRVVSTSASSTAVCAVTYTVAGLAVSTAPVTTPAIPVNENPRKR